MSISSSNTVYKCFLEFDIMMCMQFGASCNFSFIPLRYFILQIRLIVQFFLKKAEKRAIFEVFAFVFIWAYGIMWPISMDLVSLYTDESNI